MEAAGYVALFDKCFSRSETARPPTAHAQTFVFG